MYYLLPIFLFSTIFAIPYEEGEYVSEEHQSITKESVGLYSTEYSHSH